MDTTRASPIALHKMALRFILFPSLLVLILAISSREITATKPSRKAKASKKVEEDATGTRHSAEIKEPKNRYSHPKPTNKHFGKELKKSVREEDMIEGADSDDDDENRSNDASRISQNPDDPDSDGPQESRKLTKKLPKHISSGSPKKQINTRMPRNANQTNAPSGPTAPPQKKVNSSISVQKEEEKLRHASVKLVMWLRNRLRKRLNDVARLEGDMQAERIVLQNLNESIVETASAREHQIRVKITTQKKISEFEQEKEEPEKQLLSIQDTTKKLSDQLATLGENYNFLGERRRKLQKQLREAGFSHWLDMRGKEYLPATAVGVLARSTELFEPLYRDLREAMLLDWRLASTVEGLIPSLAEQSLLRNVIEEFLMLLPTIPLIMAWGKACQKLYSLSIIHAIMYEAIGFTVEFCILFCSSVFLGREIIGYLSLSKYSKFVTAVVFMNTILYIGYVFSQILVSVLDGSKYEVFQTILSFSVGYHYYGVVFRPLMLNEKVQVTAIGHLLSVLAFGLVAYEKKKKLLLKAPLEDELNELFLSMENWGLETFEAMKSIFFENDRQAESSPQEEIQCVHWPSKLYEAGFPTPRKVSVNPKRLGAAQGPALPRPGYGRWTGARTATGFRNVSSAALQGLRGQIPHITSSSSRHRTPFTNSESRNSTVYGSCEE